MFNQKNEKIYTKFVSKKLPCLFKSHLFIYLTFSRWHWLSLGITDVHSSLEVNKAWHMTWENIFLFLLSLLAILSIFFGGGGYLKPRTSRFARATLLPNVVAIQTWVAKLLWWVKSHAMVKQKCGHHFQKIVTPKLPSDLVVFPKFYIYLCFLV